MGKDVVCPKCGYAWNTESVALWVTCPHCMRKSILAAMRVIHGGPVETLDPELQEILRTKPTKCAESEKQC